MEKEINDELKEEFNEIILKKDVSAFKDFLLKNGMHLTESVQKKLLAMSDLEIREVMTFWAATQPVFAPYWEANRNALRSEQLESELELATESLKRYKSEHSNENPPCLECRWFREAPFPEEISCMQQGALPTDVACAGWTELGEENELPRSGENSSPEKRCDVSAGRITS